MQSPEDRSERLELMATVLLGLATAISAWCTYEAQLWNSIQLEQLARANSLQSASVGATELGSRGAILDATAFAFVLDAEARGDHRTSHYLAERARPQFRPGLEEWLSARATSGSPAQTPFDNRDYRASVEKRPIELRKQANAALAAARAANENSDLFVMRTVMLALSLFFLGISGQLRARRARLLSVSFGAVVLAVMLVSLTRLERAPRPHAHSGEPATSPPADE
jgi:hypothetical protein